MEETTNNQPNMSPTIGQVAKALIVAQGEFKPIKKDRVNTFYHNKYADLATIIEATKDGLANHNLVITQLPQPTTNGHIAIETMLIHSVSGEWLRSKIELQPVKDDPQSAGSAITYARRYALGAILGVASEDDDDGNAGSGKAPVPQREAKPTPTKATFPPVTTEGQQSIDRIKAGQVGKPGDILDTQVTAIKDMLSRSGLKDEFTQCQKVSELLGLSEPITGIKKLTKPQGMFLIQELGKTQ